MAAVTQKSRSVHTGFGNQFRSEGYPYYHFRSHSLLIFLEIVPLFLYHYSLESMN